MRINGTEYSESEVISVVNTLNDEKGISVLGVLAIHCGEIDELQLHALNKEPTYPIEDIYEMIRWYMKRGNKNV